MTSPSTQRTSAYQDAAWREHAELLRSTLARLCERPPDGSLWTPLLLASDTRLPITEVELAFDPGRQQGPASRPELAAWPVYESLLRVMRAGDDDHERCGTAHDLLARHLRPGIEPPSSEPPRDIAAIVTDANFMAAMATLTEKSRMSCRAIAKAMWERDARHAWSKSGLGPYITGKRLPPDKREHLRTLLSVLCERAGRPADDVEHYLRAWDSVRPRHHPVRSSVMAPPAVRPGEVVPPPVRKPLTARARRVPRTIQLPLPIAVAVALLAVVVICVALVI